MKQTIILSLTSVFLLFAGFTSHAQDYKTAVGLHLDVGNGGTFVGPHIKHFFDEKGAVEGSVVFGNGATILQAFYQYHGDISGADGLKWYLGGGPSVAFGNGSTEFLLRPMTGLDFKIKDVPIALAFDWRPWISLASNVSNRFEAGRFGLSFRYVLGD
jgi:hypothetical protein